MFSQEAAPALVEVSAEQAPVLEGAAPKNVAHPRPGHEAQTETGAPRTDAEIEVLEVDEEAFVETTRPSPALAPHQEAGPGQAGDVLGIRPGGLPSVQPRAWIQVIEHQSFERERGRVGLPPCRGLRGAVGIEEPSACRPVAWVTFQLR